MSNQQSLVSPNSKIILKKKKMKLKLSLCRLPILNFTINSTDTKSMLYFFLHENQFCTLQAFTEGGG